MLKLNWLSKKNIAVCLLRQISFKAMNGVGRIVEFVADYDELIKGGAATLQDDVYNQVIYIK
jgi:hypothetical protein